MQLALHPYDRTKKIDVSQYIMEFGRNPDAPKPICPLCKQRLSLKAVSTTASTGHFAHGPNSGFCPIKTNTAAPYKNLPPENPDREAVRNIKSTFRLHWRKHFCKLSKIIAGLARNEFTGIIKLANQQRIWEYSKLEEYQLPYVFATLTEFPPENSYRRDGIPVRLYWFRCWFDTSVRCYGDLWIHRSDPLLFCRASYQIPKGKRKPGIENLVKLSEDKLDREFLKLELEEDQPARFVQREVESWLNDHFKLDPAT